MDLILAYDEESGSCSEDEYRSQKKSSASDSKQSPPVQFQSTTLQYDCLNTSVQPVPCVSDNVNSESVTSYNSGTDFFNISSNFHIPKLEAETATCYGDDVAKQIEVPDGEFWSEFVPMDSLAYQPPSETSHKDHLKNQNINYEDSNNSYFVEAFNESRIDHSSSLSRCRVQKERNANHPYFIEHGKKHLKAGRSTINDSINSTSSQYSLDKRKVFYIHSKVAPYLHTNCVFKPALKTSSYWSVHNRAVNRLNWNLPNFSHLLVSAGMDSKICGWNVWSNVDPCVFTFTCHTKAVRLAEWCHSGRSVFSCSFDRSAQITDVETGKNKARLDHVGFVTAGSFQFTNPNLVVTGSDNVIFMWDTRTPQAPVKHYTYKENFGQVQDLTFISDDREMVSCGDQVTRDSADRSIMVWDVRSTALLSNQVFQERYTCTRLKPHKDKSHFLAQTHGGYIALFSTISPYRMEKSKRFGGHKLLGYNIGFDISPDGKLVYSGSAEGGVHVYDYHSGKLIRKLMAASGDDVIMDVACHPVLPSMVATCTWGGYLRLWM